MPKHGSVRLLYFKTMNTRTGKFRTILQNWLSNSHHFYSRKAKTRSTFRVKNDQILHNSKKPQALKTELNKELIFKKLLPLCAKRFSVVLGCRTQNCTETLSSTETSLKALSICTSELNALNYKSECSNSRRVVRGFHARRERSQGIRSWKSSEL